MITYLDYTLVPLPCPRTQHSRLFLSRKPLTLKIRPSAIPFLWKRVNNMFQRDWKVIFFFYQKPCTSKLPSTVRSKQTLRLHQKWPELPDQDWNPDFSIWSPALQTQGDHNSHVTWSSLHWKKARSVNPPADGAWKLLDGALALLLPTSLTATTRKVYLTCGDNAICTHPFWGSDPLEMTFHVVGANCVVCSIITFFIGLPFAFPRIHVTLTCSPSACPWLMVTSVGGLGGP